MGTEKPQVKTLLARQPIYSAQKDLFGFELLFRHEMGSSAHEFGEELATSEVLLNLYTGTNQQSDLFSRKIFVNISEGLLLSDAFLPVPPESVIIDLSPSIQVNEPLINSIKKWRDAGFSFALDGFDFSPRFQPVLDYIQYIKVDALNESMSEIDSKMKNLSHYSVNWIAERVETETQFTKFKELGFTLFQGYFLAKPTAIQGQPVRGKINNSIATIKAVSDPEIEVAEMTNIVNRDPSLAIQLLKIVNSPVYSLGREVNSVRDAIVYLGLIQVRKWIIMMSMLNNMVASSGTVNLVLTRAKACENYVEKSHAVKSDQAFLVGLLSGVHLLFGIDNKSFFEQISLPDTIKEAILEEEGVLGQTLSEIIKTEYNILQNTSEIADQDDIGLSAYREASTWTEEVLTVADDG
ncbi:HDOD domain-containing protein [uncultured Desulfuromusa sp.]|uniref:EAL and HDOD domain-containing protein n=1 Tax=uncultured Desulfuromusa sp. TaxID=219183 RepID=UPI002AA70049|nr:HDOD domain-containing protein [uncultured Desulfuromusa sp.]